MSANPPNFLNVSKSVKGQAWVSRLGTVETRQAENIRQTHSVSEITARLLAARGVTSETAASHLEPTIRDLMPDPDTITDMAKAASRLAHAIQKGQRIAVFGDYDVDGAASSALLTRYLSHFEITPTVYIPDRIFEGYGPNDTAIAELSASHDLIVLVDCGTNSAKTLQAATAKGVDCIVLDHHQVGGALPLIEAVANPNRDDDISGLEYLCAASVVFMALVATQRILRNQGIKNLPDLMAMLDLVAMATICDVVPLKGLNRAFVKKGTLVARQRSNVGMAALADAARLSGPINTHHFGFMLGPRINAGGRIGNAALGAELLAATQLDRAQDIAAMLDKLNAERQAMEADMLAEAKATASVELSGANPPSLLVLASTNWHPGIVGLIASRLKDAFHRPAFAIAIEPDGTCKGSARSIHGVDIGKLVQQAVEAGHLEKGGGHAMAAGLTARSDKLPALRAFFEEKAGEAISRLVATQSLKIDAAITARAVNVELLDTLDRCGPFGSAYPTPVFALPSHRVTHVKPVGSNHLRVDLASNDRGRVEAMAFGAADSELGSFLTDAVGGAPIHIAGTVSPNTWRGETRPQLRILDAAST
ncbi:MAG: single-stranded-DNA-specific exonuclease RecJ [Pseudomonadota bacterium]